MALHVINHPLVKHKLGLLREKDLPLRLFRETVKELCCLLAYEATREVGVESALVQGWAGPVTVERMQGAAITAVPILRAGLGMLPGFLEIAPEAVISTVGIFRDEKTLKPVSYHVKLADGLAGRQAFVLDPMLATGGSVCATVELLKKAGCRKISGLFLVAAPEGVHKAALEHPDFTMYTAALDHGLNADSYILPGLGDAGDRLFGT